MGHDEDLAPLYRSIGDFFKQHCQGWQGYVFTGNMTWGKKIGLRTNSKQTFFNSRIECKLLGFRLYAGSVRSKYAAAGDERPAAESAEPTRDEGPTPKGSDSPQPRVGRGPLAPP